MGDVGGVTPGGKGFVVMERLGRVAKRLGADDDMNALLAIRANAK